jgi:hypothetical protein
VSPDRADARVYAPEHAVEHVLELPHRQVGDVQLAHLRMKMNPSRLTSRSLRELDLAREQQHDLVARPSLYEASTGPTTFGSNCDVCPANMSRPKIVRPLSGGATGVPSDDTHLSVRLLLGRVRASSGSESTDGAGTATVSHLMVLRDAASHGRLTRDPAAWKSAESG